MVESQGELRRGIENVEVATGIPSLMMGYNVEDIARGIDEHMLRQPVGVVAAITPFNFPGMIPLWFLPYAIACGNCFILKPSEKVPMTMSRVFDLIDELGLPPGVISLVNGSKEVVDALLDHPVVRAISFVGSSPVAKYVYSRAAANGKRAQCQGGARPGGGFARCRYENDYPASSRTRLLGAQDNVVWRPRWQSQLARLAPSSGSKSPRQQRRARLGTGLIPRSRWDLSSRLRANSASSR